MENPDSVSVTEDNERKLSCEQPLVNDLQTTVTSRKFKCPGISLTIEPLLFFVFLADACSCKFKIKSF